MSSPQHFTLDNLITPQALQNHKPSNTNKSPLKGKTLTDELANLKIKQGKKENKDNSKTVESVEGKSDEKSTKRTTVSGKSTIPAKIRREEQG